MRLGCTLPSLGPLAGPEAIVLVADPPSGAAILRDWSLLVGSARWYFAPSLETDAFTANVPPGSVQGMSGVAPALSASVDFPIAFAQRRCAGGA